MPTSKAMTCERFVERKFGTIYLTCNALRLAYFEVIYASNTVVIMRPHSNDLAC